MKRRFAIVMVAAILIASGERVIARPIGVLSGSSSSSPASPLALALLALAPQDSATSVAQSGSIRGVIYDKDFESPLALAKVLIVETGAQVTATEDGHYVFAAVPAGRYTLAFSKDGYTRQLQPDVVVTAGQIMEVDAELSGEFTEMEEYVIQDIQIAGTEISLLNLRMESPSLIDSIGADMMSRAGASDAASALNLVAGATVQDGKYAVIRGLPDRYVNSQLNGVRLPTADEDKRAVELDQFPAAVIESVQVSKTFTPDQQGDASGGAVNVILKGIPDETILQFKSQVSFNSQAAGRSDFLTYSGGGVSTWGDDRGDRDQQLDNIDGNWDGAVGVTRGDAPVDHKWSLAAGGKHEFDNGWKVGGFASFFYERDSSFFDNGRDDSWWVTTPGGPMVPETTQGTPSDGDFKTKLFDVTQSSQSVQWGGLGILGVENEHHAISMTYLYTRTTEDTVTLAEDTRGKAYFFPGYDRDDPFSPGNEPGNLSAAPYIRTETLEYTERSVQTLMFKGRHTIPTGEFGADNFLMFKDPVIDWTVAFSSATLYQPDKRQFGSLWLPASFNPGFPPFIPPFFTDPIHLPFTPSANFNLGNLQRIWKDIQEDSDQYAVNLKLPFTQWTDDEGYLKFGVFDDTVNRKFDQDTYTNSKDAGANYIADWEEYWSEVFPTEDHAIHESTIDVDYRGQQDITAWYAMADVPIFSGLNVIGGARFEDTSLSIVNDPEVDAVWFPPGTSVPVAIGPGVTDVDYKQKDILPSIGVVVTPWDDITFRASYARTIARQTFKELTPIQQQEFLGGEVFIGNPDLRMSALENFDLRLDYSPYPGGLFSVSYFKKDITDPIEYVQRLATFTYTTAVNYSEGSLSGFELEARQDLGHYWDRLTGLSVGANATFIDSEVVLPPDEVSGFSLLGVPMSTRDMTNTPEHLYNLYLTYDFEQTGTQFSIFYTVKGDTLIAGAGSSAGNFIPSVYALEYGTLNLSISQKLGKYFKLQFQVKNLTNPRIDEAYRSPYIGADVLRSSYTKGIEFAIGLSAEFTF